MTSSQPQCDNEACLQKDKAKLPSGKGVNPDNELVLVELLIYLPNRLRAQVAGSAWVCLIPCLVSLGPNIRCSLKDFTRKDSIVRWRYYADWRYALAKDFAEALPKVYEKILLAPPPKQKPNALASLFKKLFRRQT